MTDDDKAANEPHAPATTPADRPDPGISANGVRKNGAADERRGPARPANENGDENAADEKAMLAAEYALGTLDSDDRANVQMLMAIDPGFAAAVAEWERRLGELHALVSPIEPPASTWDWVKARIAAEPQAAKLWLPPVEEVAEPPPPRPPQVPVEELAAAPIALWRARARSWRGVAAGIGAAAAALIALVVARDLAPGVFPAALQPPVRIVEKEVVRTVEVVREVPSPRIAQYVAMLQRDAASPAFVLTFDMSRRTLSVRRMSVQQQTGKDYELWLVSDKFPAPRSLGTVGAQEYTVRRDFADYDAPTLNAASYAISLEPSGGSPTGVPTGPVMFRGKLMQTTPPAFPEPAP